MASIGAGNREQSAKRRHLLAARGSHDAAPRVVLRLPDLDALTAVAVGPPQKASRRRIDAAHVVEQVVPAPTASRVAAPSGEDSARQFVHLLKGPAAKLLPPWLVGGAGLLGKALVVLQQPKMALAAVVAIGLQLAAVLAMLAGNAKQEESTPATPTPIAVHAKPGDPIQTPMTVFGGAPGAPPQTLPGLDADDLPQWPTESNAPALAGPVPAPSGAAMQPARLPTLAPPPQIAPPRAATTLTPEALPELAGPKSAPALETSDAAPAQPKARLQGTIKKISTRGTTP